MILYDILANGGQSGPLAVVYGLGAASLVHLVLANLAAQTMRSHTVQSIPADVAVGWPGVACGVPLVVSTQQLRRASVGCWSALCDVLQGAQPLFHLFPVVPAAEYQRPECRSYHLKTIQNFIFITRKNLILVMFYTDSFFLIF